MQEKRAPVMAGLELINEEDYFDLSLPRSLDNITLSPPRTTAYDGDDEDDSNFVFNIDESLLVDPRRVLVGEMIGEGSYSVVHQGIYNSRAVAVKIIQPTRTYAVTREHKEKFQREVNLLSKMNHENVLKLVGASVDPVMIILTELVRGETLQKFLWNSRPGHLDMKLSLSLALGIAQALKYLHANGVIHRDLKPSNILLTKDTKEIKVADFGLAREEIVDEMTCEAGTYRWMAPELFSRDPIPNGVKKHYDHKVDVYSFAIVMWELVTNKTPFKGRDNITVAYAASKNERPSLENLSDDIAALLQSCWAEDPKVRPEFSEITVTLTKLLEEICPTETIPIPISIPTQTEVVEIEDSNRDLKEESSAANDVINKTDKMFKTEKKCKKRRKVLTFLLGCLGKCFPVKLRGSRSQN